MYPASSSLFRQGQSPTSHESVCIGGENLVGFQVLLWDRFGVATFMCPKGKMDLVGKGQLGKGMATESRLMMMGRHTAYICHQPGEEPPRQ